MIRNRSLQARSDAAAFSIALLLAAVVFSGAASAQAQVPAATQPPAPNAQLQQNQTHPVIIHLDAGSTTIQWTLRGSAHNAHGTFQIKGGLITFNPATGVADGEILVDVATGASGNAARDGRMRSEVLETQKYPTAFFHPTLVTGTLKPGNTERLTMQGTLNIHGADHPLILKIDAKQQGTVLAATTHFLIPYVAWGMKDPSMFVFRVARQVEVDVTAHGSIEGAP